MGMSADRWKRQERLVAEVMGGRRVPNNGFGQNDVEHEHFAIQVKTVKNLPKWFATFWDQTARDAEAAEKAPLLAICHAPAQGKAVRRFAVVPLDDLAVLYRLAARGVEENATDEAVHNEEDETS